MKINVILLARFILLSLVGVDLLSSKKSMSGLVSGEVPMRNCIQSVDKLSFPFTPPSPFLFLVYHKDAYPAGNDKCEAPRTGDGMDFNPNADYRMYHGTKIPGFPQHPHRGFETLTATIEGYVDHTDSEGNGGRYGGGDNQWMTAGRGICHAEMFPLINSKGSNHLRFFQIWLNLPARSKMADPFFTMHWRENIPKWQSDEAEVTIWAGSLDGIQPLAPPPHSWAADEANEVAVWLIKIQPHGSFKLLPAIGGSEINRQLYWVEGKDLVINKSKVSMHAALTLDASETALLRNRENTVSEVLLLQGRPIAEPVAKHGPFVMNTQQEIQTAFADYRRTQFGGWPWPRDDMVFPADKGRFALQKGIEERPPTKNQNGNEL